MVRLIVIIVLGCSFCTNLHLSQTRPGLANKEIFWECLKKIVHLFRAKQEKNLSLKNLKMTIAPSECKRIKRKQNIFHFLTKRGINQF